MPVNKIVTMFSAGVLFIILVFIAGSVIWSKLIAKKTSSRYIDEVEKQMNPFKVTKDSADILWNRAIKYLDNNKLQISGGELQVSDTLLYVPYHNNSGDIYHRGPSIKIIKRDIGDSTAFFVAWFNRGERQNYSERALAHYMVTGKNKYDPSFK